MKVANWVGEVLKFKVRAVTDTPLIFGTAILIIAGVFSILGAANWLVILFAICACFLLVIGVSSYVFFAIKKPEFLRSEEYQTRKEAMEFLGDNERSLNPNVPRIANMVSPTTSDDKSNPLMKS